MKTASLVFFLVIGLTRSALAQQDDPIATPQATVTAKPASVKPVSAESLELDVNGGYVVAGNSIESSQYGAGGGGGLALLFPLNENFSLGVMGGFYTFGQSVSAHIVENFGAPLGTITENSFVTFNTQSVEVMLAAKYRFGGKDINPYVFGGVGISDYSPTESEWVQPVGSAPSIETIGIPSQVDPMLAAGFGLNFLTGNTVGIFIQGKESFILTPTTPTTFTTNELNETEYADGVYTYTAFEGGLSFDIR